MKKVDITFSAKSANIMPSDKNEVIVEVTDGVIKEILDYIEDDEIVEHYGFEKLLKEIGTDVVKDYLELIEISKYDAMEEKHDALVLEVKRLEEEITELEKQTNE